jgi:undecaprenyl diphosphate synthase
MKAEEGHVEYDEFMRLSDDEVSHIVRDNGAPTSVCVVDDATRRTGQVFFGLDPTEKDFIRKLNRRLSRPYQRIFSSCFNQGVQTLFVPAMTYGCYNRGDAYQKKIMDFAREVFEGDYWLGYFHDEDIKLKFYGDFDFLRELGYTDLFDSMKEVEDTTRHGKKTLYLGFATSTHREEVRAIVNYANKYGLADFESIWNNRFNTVVKEYYGEPVKSVEVFIRPCELRLSETMPPFLGEYAELYFTPAPITEVTHNFYRRIVYDFLYSRRRTFGSRAYLESEEPDGIAKARDAYARLEDKVVGIGTRIGGWWVFDLD